MAKRVAMDGTGCFPTFTISMLDDLNYVVGCVHIWNNNSKFIGSYTCISNPDSSADNHIHKFRQHVYFRSSKRKYSKVASESRTYHLLLPHFTNHTFQELIWFLNEHGKKIDILHFRLLNHDRKFQSWANVDQWIRYNCDSMKLTIWIPNP